MVVEGGGAVGLAALLSGSLKISDSSLPIVVVISGGNVASDQLTELYGP
jgi:threonine dehydratase